MKSRNGSLCRAGIVFAIGLICFPFNNTFAYSNGATGYSGANNGTNCGTCHMGGTAPTVALDGPATATPGSVNSYTFTITGGPGVVSGLGVSASGGTITDTNASGTTILNGELVNSSANMMSMSGGMASISWTFDWTAPTTAGTYTLYAAGVSADGPMASGSTGSGGDGVAATTLDITVAAAANQPPVAAISAPATGVENTDITFDGSGSSDPDGTIASYDWDFGDGTAGSGASVTHAFAAGTYTVTLTVTDDAGATASTVSDVTISAADAPQAPVANAGGPYSATVGEAVQFDGSASTDPDGSIASYEWDFGNGNTDTGVSPVHMYDTAGTYTVTLTVTDDSGMTATGGTTAEITDAPVVDTPTDPPAPADPPAPVTGETLYNDNCGACHGAGGTGGTAGSIVDESSPGDIMEAIREVTDMQFLADALSADDVAAISAYLSGACDQATVTTVSSRDGQDEGSDGQGGSGKDEQENEGGDGHDNTGNGDTGQGQGEDGHGDGHPGQGGNDGACVVQQQGPAGAQAPQNPLYNQYCAGCHGPNGGNVVNSSATDISNAILNVRAMRSLSSLSSSDIDNIAAYLNSPAITTLSASDNGGQSHGGAASADSGGGALHWLSLLLGGVWVAIRRKFR
jgi:PKD repeat protein